MIHRTVENFYSTSTMQEGNGEEGDETELEPLNSPEAQDNININIVPSAPAFEDLPNHPQQQNHGQQQQQYPQNNAQQIIIEPSPSYNQQGQQIPNQGQIIIEPQQYDSENQPFVQQNQAQNIPQDNQITPSQDQIAAVLPSFDTSDKSQLDDDDDDREGIGCIEGCRQSPHIITWLLTLLIWSMFILALIFFINNWEDWYIFIIIGCCGYIGYLIETGCSSMHRYLSHILEKEGAKDFINRLKNEPIEIWWTIRCYHWETRTRVIHERDNEGRSRTRYETYQEKVYTWSATQQYRYNICVDISGQVLGLDEHKITRLNLHKAYQFRDDETKRDYIMSQEMFKRNNWRDTHQEFKEETKIRGYIDRILAESEPGIKPGWMSLGVFWMLSIFGCSPCYRQALVSKCGNIDFALIKQIQQ